MIKSFITFDLYCSNFSDFIFCYDDMFGSAADCVCVDVCVCAYVRMYILCVY